jgi:hypothetical protein
MGFIYPDQDEKKAVWSMWFPTPMAG